VSQTQYANYGAKDSPHRYTKPPRFQFPPNYVKSGTNNRRDFTLELHKNEFKCLLSLRAHQVNECNRLLTATGLLYSGHQDMKERATGVSFRRVLPIVQLLVCVISLWPSRYFVLFQFSQSLHAYALLKPQQPLPLGNIELSTLTSQQQQEADRAARIVHLRMELPVALNFPALIAQLPYIVLIRREWVPIGMMRIVWRGLSWSLAGVFFWWLAGRGADALRAAWKSVLAPRITMAETIFAGLLFAIGVATLVGILTSTPDDRRDIDFLALIAGGLLWGVLAALTIAARLLQWRLRKHVTLPALA
jgi:hypothetical protein